MSWFNGSYLVDLLKDQNQRLTGQNEWLQSRVETLTTQILEMKQQGFVHEPTIINKPLEDDLPDVVASAISAAGPRLEPELTEWARAMLRAGVDEEHVADNLLKGGNDA